MANLTQADVRGVCDAIGAFRYVQDAEDIVITGMTGALIGDDVVRIQPTHAGTWVLLHGTTGAVIGRPVTTRAALHRAIIAHLAGPPPVDVPPGYVTYARTNHNRFGLSYVWIIRKARIS